MDNNMNMSREELEKAIEKAKRDLQETLDKMTPEEREQAELAAQKIIEEDAAKRQRLIDEAMMVAGGASPAEKTAPKFCKNCGAPVSGGKFCEYCGKPL